MRAAMRALININHVYMFAGKTLNLTVKITRDFFSLPDKKKHFINNNFSRARYKN
ncbi:hypothetical protein Lfee_2215 [Legionella feeleii]|uniref:Uncharacterized protein n=1 Tax=Legionella feeleii TaxID=453 RepID=A0A0W0TLF0_9GAMM|nr:hypothetical protein Lfee_2215 [Legionella feeleii]SPX61818.1 Uncharacterised protein [Legionella feeleii]